MFAFGYGVLLVIYWLEQPFPGSRAEEFLGEQNLHTWSDEAHTSAPALRGLRTTSSRAPSHGPSAFERQPKVPEEGQLPGRNGVADRGVQRQNIRHSRRSLGAAKPAFGGNAEIAQLLSRCRYSLARAFNPVLEMHQTEIDFGVSAERQPAQRREIGGIVARDRHRHVNVGQLTARLRRNRVGKLDHGAGIDRLDLVDSAPIAVAEMKTELDCVGHRLVQSELGRPQMEPRTAIRVTDVDGIA